MRKLNITILVGALVALLGFALVFGYGTNVDRRVADGQETTKVLVAGGSLASGATPASLTGSVATMDIPQRYLAEGALTSLDDVVGKVLLGPVAKGAQLTLAQFGSPTTAGAVVPSKGRVALAVGVSLTPGVARYITPGSSVDVFVTYGGNLGGRTKLFATNVRVMSVSVAAPQPTADGQPAATNSTGDVVAVLDVAPSAAEKLVNAATLGQLYLALSSVDGKGEEHKTQGATPTDVVSSNR